MQNRKRLLWRRALRDERGSEMLEFALASMVFFTMVLGVIDIGRAMYAYHFVTYAAQAGARYAIVRGADYTNPCSTSAPPSFTLNYKCNASATDVQNYVKSLPSINYTKVTATTTWPGTTPGCTSGCSACTTVNAQGCMVKVKVNYAFKFFFPGFNLTTVNFYGTSAKSIQQ